MEAQLIIKTNNQVYPLYMHGIVSFFQVIGKKVILRLYIRCVHEPLDAARTWGFASQGDLILGLGASINNKWTLLLLNNFKNIVTGYSSLNLHLIIYNIWPRHKTSTIC